MRGWLCALAVVAVGAAACASRSSPTVGQLLVSRIDAGPPPPQPATIDEAIGGRKFTGHVSVSYGDDDGVGIASRPGGFASSCNKKMEDWTAGGRRGKAPCATATLELDGEPPNFWVASMPPSVGGASPLLDIVLDATLRMFRDPFEIIGASTPGACEALRPRNGDGRLGDGRCQPARLDIY